MQLEDQQNKLKKEQEGKAEISKKDDEVRKLEAQIEQERRAHEGRMAQLLENFRSEAASVRRVHFDSEAPQTMPQSAFDPDNPDAPDLTPAPRLEPDALEVEAASGVGWREIHDREENRARLMKAEVQSVT